jgi:8-oxo-dGTP pyrophosphatase MutT (NUDIX family)
MKDVALALVRRGDRWFLQRRDLANPVMPGLWEFPGGKVEEGETPEAALIRELREEVGLVPRNPRPWPILVGAVRLHPFLVGVDEAPCSHLAWGWFTAEELLCLPIPPMNVALIARLIQAAGGQTGPFLLI